MFEAVLFDMIGTTVTEEGNDVIMQCLTRAFEKHAGPPDAALLRENRGRDKKVMITLLLDHNGSPTHLVSDIYKSFELEFKKSLHLFSENTGAAEIFSYLKKKNIKTGIGTGLERDLFLMIYERLGWSKYQFDYIGIGAEFSRGRPYPDMILDMMTKLSLVKTSAFLKVGDTLADIGEGKNAGVVTAVILSGTQDRDMLINACPDFVIESLTEIKKIIDCRTGQQMR